MKLHLPIRLLKSVLSCLVSVACLTVGSGVVVAEEQASIVLGEQEKLTIDYADTDTLQAVDGILQLMGGTQLDLSNCGEGDGKTYTLLTGVEALLDAEGNVIVLDSSNNSMSHYFDTTRPGVGFWADATLSLTDDGTLQLLRHQETVKAARTITSRQTYSLVHSYYAGISFEDITYSTSSSSAYGGAIYGGDGSTIELSNNGSVTFIGNTAPSTSFSCGGAIYGGSSSTITLSNNGSVTFSGNTAASGGAIYGASNSTIELSGNGSVTFSGNSASSSGGAIYGAGNSTITLSNNGSVTFSGNTAFSSFYGGGAIYTYGNLSIRNNDSVLFEKNAEKSGSSYRLRSIYAGGSGDVISLSAAEGKSIEFRDSVYMASGSTMNLNADYTDAEGVVHKQTGDIIFTGKYTEEHLNELLAADGLNRTATELEILNSRTTEVYAMTNLYGGRLRVEDGAVYAGYGITAMADSAATVLVKDASLNHNGYDLTFHAGTTLELAGENMLYGDVRMLEGSHFSVSIEKPNVDYIFGHLQLGGDVSLSLSDSLMGENTILMYVSGGISGWNEDNITLHSNTAGLEDLTWVENMLVLNHNADTFNCYFNGEYSASERLIGNVGLLFYAGVSFENISGGAIYGGSSSTITLSNNGSVTFSGNTAASGGAIYGASNSTIELSGNGSVTFSGNSASSSGGAISGGSGTIELSNNGSVEFSGNTAYSSYASGGAIYGSTIMLSGNGSVTFSGNTASDSGGAIYGGTILNDNESVTFIGNTASDSGGAIYGGTILNDNESVTFIGNTASDSGGAIYGSTIELMDNGSVEFSGNEVFGSSYDSEGRGGAICGISNSTITLSNNGSVTFSGNTAASGGAIYGASNSTIELSGNGSVTFSENTVSDPYTYGGAIYGDSNSTITLSNNGSVEFIGNTAFDSGGAIYGSTITLNDNESVEFSGNSSYHSGRAIYGSTIELSNNGSVMFSDNDSICGRTIVLRGNDSVTFIENTGGAIYREWDGTIELSGNDRVTFIENSGGAIIGYGGTIELSGNESVTFSGNDRVTYIENSGAIYTSGNLSIRNNDSVLFEKNAERRGGSYRLRSIYAGGSGDVISLSAAEGKSIEFRDSVYIASGSTMNLNADYTDAEGVVHKQTGDIIFTGKYTEAHLNELLAADGLSYTATEQEILNSRTTEVQAMTNLYGGRLRVEDGAVYKGCGLEAFGDSTVLIDDGVMDHSGYAVTFHSGTTLEIGGSSILNGNVDLLSGSTLSVLNNASLTMNSQSVLLVETGANILIGDNAKLDLFCSSEFAHGVQIELASGASVSNGITTISNAGTEQTVQLNAADFAAGTMQKVENTHVAVESDADTTVDYQLVNSSVENRGSGKLTLTHAQNSITAVHSEGGAIDILNVDTSDAGTILKLATLELHEGATLGVYTGNTADATQEAWVQVSGSAVFGKGTTINADLELMEGCSLTLHGTVNMGSDLRINGTLTLDGEMLAQIQAAEIGASFDLFTGIDNLYLSGAQYDSITLSDDMAAATYFVGLEDSLDEERGYRLTYASATPGAGVLSVHVVTIPEPTTATLSLLALAALVARRRRK